MTSFDQGSLSASPYKTKEMSGDFKPGVQFARQRTHLEVVEETPFEIAQKTNNSDNGQKHPREVQSLRDSMEENEMARSLRLDQKNKIKYLAKPSETEMKNIQTQNS